MSHDDERRREKSLSSMNLARADLGVTDERAQKIKEGKLKPKKDLSSLKLQVLKKEVGNQPSPTAQEDQKPLAMVTKSLEQEVQEDRAGDAQKKPTAEKVMKEQQQAKQSQDQARYEQNQSNPG